MAEPQANGFASAEEVRWFVGILLEEGLPAVAVGALFGLGWDELARLAAGDDAAWDDQPAAVRARGAAIIARVHAEAERRAAAGLARGEAAPVALAAPDAPVEPAAGATPAGAGDRAGRRPSLSRRLLAELRRLGVAPEELSAGFSLSPEELARLEAGDEAVWTGKPLADRLRALERLGPFLVALDPDAPMPAPNDARPGRRLVSLTFPKPDGQGTNPGAGAGGGS